LKLLTKNFRNNSDNEDSPPSETRSSPKSPKRKESIENIKVIRSTDDCSKKMQKKLLSAHRTINDFTIMRQKLIIKKIRKNNRINFMAISICFLHILGNVPFCIYLLFFSSPTIKTILNQIVLVLSLFLLYLSRSCSIFIFYFTNVHYRFLLNHLPGRCLTFTIVI